LSATTGTWDTGVSFTYQWLRDGSAIANATNSTYTLVAADQGHAISVSVKGSKASYASVTKTSAASASIGLGTLASTPSPTISGTTQVGQTLSATTGTWDTGVSFTYQWLRDGSAIANATNSTYTLVAADQGHTISVAVTGSKTGYASVTKTSAASASIGLGTLASTPSPTISGTTQVGQTLSATTGTWDTGVSFTYQWLRDGSAIANATNSTYTLVAADQGHAISVSVKGSKTGYASVTKTSLSTSAILGTLASTPSPTISGTTQVGQTLSATTGTWDTGVSFTYQWLRDGSAIANATNSTYTLVAADQGHAISVSVKGSKASYASVTKTSLSTSAILGTLASTPSPTISGTTQVGQTLSATTGTWDTGVSFTYQWLRDGSAIANATNSTYTLVAADQGHTISVAVTGSKTGYVPATATSTPLYAMTTVPSGILLKTPVPVITSSTQQSSTTWSANAGTWDTGVSFTYQWLRDGVAVTGATGSRYVSLPSDSGHWLTVIVTGSKAGSRQVLRASLPMWVH
jgi:hypothetical protein